MFFVFWSDWHLSKLFILSYCCHNLIWLPWKFYSIWRLASPAITRFPISLICLDIQDFLGKRFLEFWFIIFLDKNSIPATLSCINIHFKDPLPLPTFHLWPLKVWLMLGRWGNINIASNAIFANCSGSWGEGHILSFHVIFWVDCFHLYSTFWSCAFKYKPL